MDVATDTCILINLAVVSRLDLLSLVPPFVFHAPAEVLDEIEDPEQKTAVEQGIAAGFLDVVKLEDPNELGSYVGFNAILDPNRFQIEAMVTPELDQKIDIVDSETACAYEFKVSGKNAWAEFYKDVVKVLMWNQHREKKLSCLTFITGEKYGKPFLDAPMPRAYIKYLTEQGLRVSIEYVRHG